MTEYITQEQAIELANQQVGELHGIKLPLGPYHVHLLCNAAIQWKLDSQPASVEDIMMLADKYRDLTVGHGTAKARTELQQAITRQAEALASACAKIERLEASELQLIDQRDHREEIINQLCDAVLGDDRHEWSSDYHFEDAVEEVEVKEAVLSAEVSELYQLRAQLAALQFEGELPPRPEPKEAL